jgi:hypothetical protein
MIFSQYELVLRGLKTETRRFRAPLHVAQGKSIAAVPRRARPAWWLGELDGLPAAIRYPGPYVATATGRAVTTVEAQRWLFERGFIGARLAVLAVWSERLQALDEDGARREGVASVDEYIALWNRINDVAGRRWADNPIITPIRYERTEAVARLADAYFSALDSGAPVAEVASDSLFESGAWK